MLDEFRSIDLKWNNAYERLGNVRTAQFDERGRKLVVQVTDGGDIVDLSGVELKLVTVDGIEVDERNYFSLNKVNNTAIMGSVVNGTIIGKDNYKSFYLPVKKGEVWSLSRTKIGNANRFGYTFSEDEPLIDVEVSGGVDHRNDLTVEGIKIPYDGWMYIYLANNVANSESLPIIKLEKGTKATDWTPAPEDLRFSFDLVDAQKGIYELYFPKLFVDNYTGNTKVFLELSTNEFSITSEPFYINVFDGVR